MTDQSLSSQTMIFQRIVLGLGSNLGKRLQYLKRGCAALRATTLDASTIRYSPIYENEPLLPQDAPEAWKALPYLNMAVYGYTSLTPEALLETIKTIERQLGPRDAMRCSPRALDIDILAYGVLHHHSPLLAIPHPALLTRRFALVPLARLWPSWRYPVPGPWMGVDAQTLVKRLDATLLPLHLQEMQEINR